MAWNEPGGEKRNPWNRPQQAQNDLDDVLRNLQRKLSGLFGRGGAGGGAVPGSSNVGRGVGTGQFEGDLAGREQGRRTAHRLSGSGERGENQEAD